MSKRPHVIPVGGEEPAHECHAACWCFPRAVSREGGVVMVHNAKDCREARERHGAEVSGEFWVTIIERLTWMRA